MYTIYRKNKPAYNVSYTHIYEDDFKITKDPCCDNCLMIIRS